MANELLFKPIPNFEDYLIDKNGNIYSIKKKKFIKHYEQGYISVSLYSNGKMCRKYLHRILGLTFICNPNNKPCIDHIDRNKLNNKLDNLRWCTYLENRQNSGKNSNNKIGHKHISIEFYNTKSLGQSGRYRLCIRTNNIKIYKTYDISKYTLNDVIIKRNRLLNNMNLLISD